MEDRGLDEAGFIPIHPKKRNWDTQKGQGRGEKYNADDYDEFKDDVDERKLDQQIRAVASSIKSKPIRDVDNFYFVIESTDDATTGALYGAIRRLNATVRAYLDEDHRVLLVSTPASALSKFQRKELPLVIKGPILRIRELSRSEQIGKSLDAVWDNARTSVVVNIMPNEKAEVLQKYLGAITKFLQERNCPIIWTSVPQLGMMTTEIEKRMGDELIEQTNYIFRIHTLPIGIESKGVIHRKPKRVLGPKAKASSMQPASKVSIQSLPEVCVIDSGVTAIKQLVPLITERKAMKEFKGNLEDEGKKPGHGTPIAYLVAFGENDSVPRARIISYKVFSESTADVAYKGMFEAIQEYRDRTKIFVSSINFDDDSALPYYAKLDNLIQESNVCFVNSGGNLSMEEVRGNASDYPSYLPNFPLLHPAQNVHITGVGAVARVGNEYTIAAKDGLSPFTRCGTSLLRLYDTVKPDVVDNGGNLTKAFESSGVGITSYCRDGSSPDDLTGTSFSAPLIAGKLAEIVSRFGSNHNAELYQALLLLSSTGPNPECFGHGVPAGIQDCSHNQAVFFSEGSISLSDKTGSGVEHMLADRISVPVPEGVRRIEMLLVHSDDFYDEDQPSLDTFLRVNAYKEGRPSSRVPAESDKQIQNEKSYIKSFLWRYKTRDMGATWNFDIIPETTIDIDPVKQANIKVRYACLIRITSSRSNVLSLTYQVRQMMKQWERV